MQRCFDKPTEITCSAVAIRLVGAGIAGAGGKPPLAGQPQPATPQPLVTSVTFRVPFALREPRPHETLVQHGAKIPGLFLGASRLPPKFPERSRIYPRRVGPEREPGHAFSGEGRRLPTTSPVRMETKVLGQSGGKADLRQRIVDIRSSLNRGHSPGRPIRLRSAMKDSCTQRTASLFNHLVGAYEIRRWRLPNNLSFAATSQDASPKRSRRLAERPR